MTAGSSAGDALAHSTATEDKRRGPPTLPELLGAAQGDRNCVVVVVVVFYHKRMNGTLPCAGSRALLCVEAGRISSQEDSLFFQFNPVWGKDAAMSAQQSCAAAK